MNRAAAAFALALSGGLGLLMVGGVDGPLRGLTALVWFLVVPGMGWAWRLPLATGTDRVVVAVGASLALATLLSLVLLGLGILEGGPLFLALSAASILGFLLPVPATVTGAGPGGPDRRRDPRAP